jgi:hypothetical protein
LNDGSQSELSAALEVAHLSPEEQKRSIKRFKDRIMKRLVRRMRSSAGAPAGTLACRIGPCLRGINSRNAARTVRLVDHGPSSCVPGRSTKV